MPAFGADLPPEFAWQRGKTAASITFVKDALEYLRGTTDREERSLLQEAVRKLKSGEVQLSQWLKVREYLLDPKF